MEGTLVLFESNKGGVKQQLMEMVVEGREDTRRGRTTNGGRTYSPKLVSSLCVKLGNSKSYGD